MNTMHLPTELKKIEETFKNRRLGCCGGDGCPHYQSDEDVADHDEAIEKFYHTALLTLVKRVGEEVIGEIEPTSQADIYEARPNSVRNMLKARQRSHLDEMLQTGSK